MYDHRRNPGSQIDPTYLVPGLPVYENIALGWIEIFRRVCSFFARLSR